LPSLRLRIRSILLPSASSVTVTLSSFTTTSSGRPTLDKHSSVITKFSKCSNTSNRLFLCNIHVLRSATRIVICTVRLTLVTTLHRMRGSVVLLRFTYLIYEYIVRLHGCMLADTTTLSSSAVRPLTSPTETSTITTKGNLAYRCLCVSACLCVCHKLQAASIVKTVGDLE